MLTCLLRSSRTRGGVLRGAQRARCAGVWTSVADSERSSFLFGEPSEAGEGYKTFADMGVSPQLAVALKKIDRAVPTIIQKAAFDSIVAKKDVMICAETGSGKTLSYLLPVLQQYYTANEERGSSIGVGRGEGGSGGFKYPSTVIMVPNKDLMLQVHSMAEEVLQHANTVRTTAAGGRAVQVTCGCVERVDGHWPYSGLAQDPLTHCPDILLCTPAFLGAFIRGPRILDEGCFLSIRRLILDEADMLLEGSYKEDVENIFDVFKVLRRRVMKELDLKPHERVVQFILSAATVSTHGKYSVDQYLKKRFPRAERVQSASFHKHHPRIEQDFLHVDLLQGWSEEVGGGGQGWAEGGREGDVSRQVVVMTPARVDLVFRALVGALPPRQEGEGEEVDETWHRDQWKESSSPLSTRDIPPTMIFTNSARKARDLAAALVAHEGGVLAGAVAEFHKLVPAYEKQEALEKFRRHEESGVKVLVCTDAAARGLDLPSVEHVIQAEFALNVVQHQHRIGRASRAGRRGSATIIFDDSAKDLVQAVLRGGDEGRSIDASFSRRRGFRRTVKRRQRRRGQSDSPVSEGGVSET